MRWREGQLMQMGGQTQISSVVGGVETYKFVDVQDASTAGRR